MTHSSRRRRVTLALSVGRARNREQLSSVWPVSNLGRGLVECVGPAPDYGVLACYLHPAKILPRGECEIDCIPVSFVRIAPVRLARLSDECVITRVIRVTSLCSDYVYVGRCTRSIDSR